MRSYKADLSRRLGDAFNDVAAGAVNVPSPAQLRALAHPDQNRPSAVHLSCREVQVTSRPSQAAAYKPTHGGYPSAGARA